jgi:hypothetical protein
VGGGIRLGVAPLLLAASAGCGGGSPDPGGPGLEVDPPALELGVVRVGSAGRRRLTLSHPGPQRRALQVRVEGALAGELTVDAAPAALLASGRGTVDLVFRPGVVGTRLGRVVLALDGVDAVEVPVAGTGARPALQVRPEQVDFGAVLLGSPATATVAVTNEGAVPIQLVAVSRDTAGSAAFSGALGGQVPLAPGASAEVRLVFRPQESGPHAGRLFLVEVDPTVDAPYIRVQGVGLPLPLDVTPTALDFRGTALGDLRTRTLEVRNSDSATVTLVRLELVQGAASFEATPARPLPAALAPGEGLPVTVTYRPDRVGTQLAGLLIHSAGPAATAQVVLTGSGVSAPAADLWVTAEVALGAARVGVPTRGVLVLENRGAAPVDLLAGFPPPGAGLVGVRPLPAGARLAPGAWHAADLLWTPTAPGPLSARLTLLSTDGRRPSQVVVVHGIAGAVRTPGLLVRDPVAFGAVPRGQARTARVALLATGDGPVAGVEASLEDDAGGRFTLDPAALPPGLAPGQRAFLTLGFQDPLGLPGPVQGVLRVRSAAGDTRVTLSATTTPARVSAAELVVRATWAPGADAQVVLHLVRDGGALYDAPDDATGCRPGPDWGAPGVPDDDPGYAAGPGWAQIAVGAPAERRYAVYLEHGGGAQPVVATVQVEDEGAGLGAAQAILAPGEAWRAGVVDRGRVTFADPLLPEPAAAQDCY